jgi:hypothetical protein
MMAGIRRRYWQNHQFQDAEGLGFVERGHSCPRNPIHPRSRRVLFSQHSTPKFSSKFRFLVWVEFGEPFVACRLSLVVSP